MLNVAKIIQDEMDLNKTGLTRKEIANQIHEDYMVSWLTAFYIADKILGFI